MNLVKNRTLHPHLRDEEALVVENAIRLAIDSIINVLYGVNSARAREYQRMVADRDKEIQRLECRLKEIEHELQVPRRQGYTCGMLEKAQSSGDPQRTEPGGIEPGCTDTEMNAGQQECEMSISLGLFARPPSHLSCQSQESALPSSPSRMGLDQSFTSHSSVSSGVSEATRNLPTSPSSLVIKEEPCDVDTVLIKWEMSEERLGEHQERLGEHQERLGEHQERLGEHQERLGEHQERLGEHQERLGEHQESTGSPCQDQESSSVETPQKHLRLSSDRHLSACPLNTDKNLLAALTGLPCQLAQRVMAVNTRLGSMEDRTAALDTKVKCDSSVEAFKREKNCENLENRERIKFREKPCADPDGHHLTEGEHLRNKKKSVPMSELPEEAQRLKRAAWRAASRRYYARKVARQQATPSRSIPFPHITDSRFLQPISLMDKRRRTLISELPDESQTLQREAWRVASRRYYARKNARHQGEPAQFVHLLQSS